MPWKAQTLNSFRDELRKHLADVRSLEDFGKFLRELASSTLGEIFYEPLADKFDELLEAERCAMQRIAVNSTASVPSDWYTWSGAYESASDR